MARAASDLRSPEPGLASGRAAGRATNAISDGRRVHPGAVVPRTDLEGQDLSPDLPAARRRALFAPAANLTQAGEGQDTQAA
jgi:hypothetical protein